MAEPFEQIVARVGEQLAGEAEQARLLREREQAAAASIRIQTAEVRSSALREAGIVALALRTARVSPASRAISTEVSRKAWRERVGSPTKPGTTRSQRAIRKNAEKSMRIQQAGSFPVWNMTTSWQYEIGAGEDMTVITQRNYLGTDGTIYHGNHTTDEGFVAVETMGVTEHDLKRYSSVREGLAILVARHNISVNL